MAKNLKPDKHHGWSRSSHTPQKARDEKTAGLWAQLFASGHIAEGEPHSQEDSLEHGPTGGHTSTALKAPRKSTRKKSLIPHLLHKPAAAFFKTSDKKKAYGNKRKRAPKYPSAPPSYQAVGPRKGAQAIPQATFGDWLYEQSYFCLLYTSPSPRD